MTSISSSREEYGDEWPAHLLEQYRLYVEMADRISSRRGTTSAFFLSVNSLVLAVHAGLADSLTGSARELWPYVLPTVGVLLTFVWFALVRGYRQLNTAKYAVIHELEAELPAQPYAAEWRMLDRGTSWTSYIPLSRIEQIVPAAFCALYVSVAVALA